MAERLYILDAHSLVYQVFHAIPEMTSPDGMPTNAIFGFVRDIQAIRRDRRPDYLLCAFDAPGLTFRHELFDGYKATRSEMPNDLRPQFGVIQEILAAYQIPVLAQSGMEADDFIAAVACECQRRGIDAYLCSADKDLRQLVDGHVRILDLRKNRLIDRDYVRADWGIEPEQVVDYQSLVGDPIDNVPGIKGIGPKTASGLLQKYQTLEGIYAHIDEIPGKKLRENLLAGRSAAWMSRDLVRLKCDVPLPEDWDAWRVREPDAPRLLEIFSRCGFHRFIDDLRAAEPATETWEGNYSVVDSESDFAALLQQLAGQSRLSLYVQGGGGRASEAPLLGLAVAFCPGKAYYITLAPGDSPVLDPLERLRPILENPEIEKVGHDLKQDRVLLASHGIQLAGLAFDAMLASYLLEPGERIHLRAVLSQRFLGHAGPKLSDLLAKTKGSKRPPRIAELPIETIGPFAAEQADIALRLADVLAPRLASEGLDRLYRDVEIPLIEILAGMESTGVLVDVPRMKAIGNDLAVRLERLREEICQLAGRSFNVDSPTQLREILFKELKLPVVKRTPSGPSTDQEVLEALGEHHPICARLVEHRKFAKLKGTYVDALPELIHPRTGRIHASFNQMVAATGRLSSSEPNLQNIPIRSEEGRQIRQAFIAQPGWLLLSADYSQVELRMLAHFSGDERLKGAFRDDIDIHAAVAAQVHGVSLDQVTPDMRRSAKAVNFGIMYGLSPFGLAKQLKISQQQAAEFIDAYFDQYPGIESFFTEVLERAKRDRQVRTILGRRRPISGIKNTTGRVRNLPERTAINTVIQGSAADLIKKAMLAIQERILTERFQARCLLQIHDELVFEVPVDEVGAAARMVAREMTGCLPLEGVPLKVDVGAGPNWLDLEPVLEPALAKESLFS